MFDLVLAHTSFLGHTGYNNHAREFFTSLNELTKVRVRNFTHTKDLSYLTQKQKSMLIEQTWSEEPWKAGFPFDKSNYNNIVDIILNETDHYYFYDPYDKPYIFYNVWESTRQPDDFFKRLQEADQFWVPSNWQKQCTIEQGYDKDRVKVVPEGIDGNIFNPNSVKNPFDVSEFTFFLAGRWDYRKSTKEIIKAFLNEFSKGEPVQLVCNVDNKFATDDMKSTEERLKKYGLDDPRIIVKHFMKPDEYVACLKNCNAFVSCARSEGWNLPLIEAIACGVPTICSNYGAQLDFAREISSMVNIKEHLPPKEIYFHDIDKLQNGTWAEPDYEHLQSVMRDTYNNHIELRKNALFSSIITGERFSWKNAAAIAFKHISELDLKSKPKGIKLNIGSGTTKYDGYVNVDKYNNDADLKRDGKNLDYEDESVAEILSEHMLEHVSHRNFVDYLDEWYRVLKQQGILRLNVPDFEWCVTEWINSDDKVGFPLHRIFGSQNGEGQTHFNGFTEDTIRDHLVSSGFQIRSINKEWSSRFEQQCLLVEAIKSNDKVVEKKSNEQRTIFDDELFIIGCYANDEQKINLLTAKIKEIKKFNVPIMIVSHFPLESKVQEMVDYYIYEEENILSGDWKLNYWFLIPEKMKLISKCGNGDYQAVAIISSIKNGLNVASDFYNFAHYIESDTDINIREYLKVVREKRNENFKFTAFMYDEFKAISEKGEIAASENVGVITNIMSFDTKWFNKLLPRIKTWEEYEDHGSNIPDLIFEKWLYDLFLKDKIGTDCHVFPNDVRNKVIINRNIIDQGSTELKHKVFLSETDDNNLVLFIINETPKEIEFRIEEIEPEKQEVSGKVIGNNAEWFVMKKRKSEFKVFINDRLYDVFTTCNKTTYNETKFKFYDDDIKCIEWDETYEDTPEEEEVVEKIDPEINIHFINNPTVTISNVDADFKIQFIDKQENKLIHEENLSVKKDISVWAKCSRMWVTDWNIRIINEDTITHDYNIDFKDKNIMIYYGSKSLGDTIAWIPYVEQFKNKHKCNIIISTFWNDLFEKEYPEFKFIKPGTREDNLYASYELGCEDGKDEFRNKNNWKSQPLQKVASDILNLEFKEIKPRICIPNLNREIKEKYVCLSEHSTMACKYWRYPHAWQSVADWLGSHGYKVAVISKEKTELNGVIDLTNRSIEQTINTIRYADLCLTVSSGVAWLSWAIGTKVAMISGCTKPFCEFTTDIIRIHNDKVCNGCLNDSDVKFNKGDWNWCEHGKDFECSKNISPITVTDEIANHLNLGGLNGKGKQEQAQTKGWKKASGN